MLPEGLDKFIGRSLDTRVLEVEKGAISRFADAVGDLNPLHHDAEYAKNSRYGSIIAPPGFFGWPAKRQEFFAPNEVMDAARGILTKAGYPRFLAGGGEWELFLPVRAGDTLVASSVIKDVVEREGKSGKLFFLITETTYINQNGDVVAKTRSSSIHLK